EGFLARAGEGMRSSRSGAGGVADGEAVDLPLTSRARLADVARVELRCEGHAHDQSAVLRVGELAPGLEVVVDALVAGIELVEVLAREVDREGLVVEQGVDLRHEAHASVGQLDALLDLRACGEFEPRLAGEDDLADLAVGELRDRHAVGRAAALEVLADAAVLEVRPVRAQAGLEGTEGLLGAAQADGQPLVRGGGRETGRGERPRRQECRVQRCAHAARGSPGPLAAPRSERTAWNRARGDMLPM